MTLINCPHCRCTFASERDLQFHLLTHIPQPKPRKRTALPPDSGRERHVKKAEAFSTKLPIKQADESASAQASASGIMVEEKRGGASASSRQTEFTFEGIDLAPEGLTPEDLVLRKTLEATKVLCPYCMHYGTLWDFSVMLKRKQGRHLISLAKCECPNCGQGYLKKTLLKTAEMTMEEYAEWFWGANFGEWGIHDKVSWEKLKQRLKAHFSYENRQMFWDVYWEFKDTGDSQAREDREAFEEYKKMYGGEKQ